MAGKRSIDNQVEHARIAITGTKQHPEIKKLLTRMGYNDKKLDEGFAFIDTIKDYSAQQAESYGLQKAATARIQQDRAELKRMYEGHLTLARVALEDDITAGDMLKLWGARKRTVASWLAQISAFYTHASRYSDILGAYTITPEAIARGQAMVQAIQEARVLQARSRSDAQIATQRRRETFDELRRWMQEFRSVTRIALKDEPQYQEALGYVVKS